MGVAWSFATPMMMLVIYVFVYPVVFNSCCGSRADDMPLDKFALTPFILNTFATALTGMLIYRINQN